MCRIRWRHQSLMNFAVCTPDIWPERGRESQAPSFEVTSPENYKLPILLRFQIFGLRPPAPLWAKVHFTIFGPSGWLRPCTLLYVEMLISHLEGDTVGDFGRVVWLSPQLFVTVCTWSVPSPLNTSSLLIITINTSKINLLIHITLFHVVSNTSFNIPNNELTPMQTFLYRWQLFTKNQTFSLHKS